MKIERIDYKRKEKILTGGVVTLTAVLLGLYLNNGTVVKADSLSTGQDITQTSSSANTEAGSSTNQNENNASEAGSTNSTQTGTNTESSNSTDQNENSATETSTTNGTQTGTTTSPTDETTSQTKNQANELTRSVKNYTWNGLALTYDDVAKKLTIPGGTDANPVELTVPVALNTIADISQVKEIVINGKIKIKGSAAHLFSDLPKLTTITGLENLDTSEVTDMQGMFQNCYMLPILDLSHFNTSNVTNMSNFFWHCYSLNNLNVSSFNTAKVTDMSHMFVYCENLTNLDLSNFKTLNVTNMQEMFLGCSGLASLNVSSFNTAKVTNMSNMFQECQSLTSLNLSSFITSNVENMSWMFSFCWKLANIDFGKFDTSKVKDMMSMFRECHSLTSLDLSNFKTPNVTNMMSMFDSCTTLTELDLSSFSTSKVHSMGRMFNGCKNLCKLDISSFDMSSLDGNINIDGVDDYDIDPDDAEYITEGMLRGLSKLKILVLGPNCNLKKSDLDKDGEYTANEEEIPAVDLNSKWVNLAGGTLVDAKGKNIWSLEEMMANYKGATDFDTYIRFGVVKAHYQDTKGNKIAEDQDIRGLIGEDYDTVGKKEIPGYTCKEAQGDVTGTYDENSPKEVTYIYTKTMSEVVVHYQDESGHQINSDETLTGKIGDKYQSTKKAFTGYTFKEVKGQTSGLFEEAPKEVTYVYTKIIDSPSDPIIPMILSKVTVHYQDENGNKIGSDEVLTGRVGDSYQSIEKIIPGYTFKEVIGIISGRFAANEETVTYFYTKNGNEIATKLPNDVSKLTKPTKTHKKKSSNEKKSSKKKLSKPHIKALRKLTLLRLEQLLIQLVKILIQ